MKYFLPLIIFSILSLESFGQAGIRAGMSSGNFTNSNYKAMLGIHGGVYYRAELGFISIEPGVQFAQRGSKRNDGQTGKVITERLNYVDAPLLFRINFLPEVHLFVGPQASFLISRKYEFEGDVDTNSEAFPKTEFGGVGGIGVSFPYGVNFQVSFDIAKTDLGDYYPDKRNKVLKLSLAFDLY
ncbi:porin family protein [Algoriphagus machipongonensis]|uniref:Outer membrane protein beta-barrel domain-containing protein n=1 Tax=Algoriphagus machipongonensis TaxID=388413 RepID=A3HYK3_9BACT|nr:porin family protein [Algoriphagus machipongonensis]EAZ80339.1 hypothetical protein ALPR1_05435 [Algoriphagus machipongonensis]